MLVSDIENVMQFPADPPDCPILKKVDTIFTNIIK